MNEQQSKISCLNDLVFFLEENEPYVNQFSENLKIEDYFGKEVIKFTQDEISPESDQGKELVSKGNFIRKIGAKFFDLFKVTFTVSFAGVTLIHFEFPKLNDRFYGK